MHRPATAGALAILALLATAILASASPATAAEPPTITEFWLVDADTDTRIQLLADYETLRLPMLPAQLSIEAVANDDTESVRMEIDHALSSTENIAPYALRGDNSGDFNPAPELQIPGWITISAQPFAGNDLAGAAGDEVDLHLYLHQPDFVVTSAIDSGDWDPGDGWCSVGKPPTIIDDFTTAANAERSDWELAAQKVAKQRYDQQLKQAGGTERSEDLAPTVEITKRSSKALQRLAPTANERARKQIIERGTPAGNPDHDDVPHLKEINADGPVDRSEGTPIDSRFTLGGITVDSDTTWTVIDWERNGFDIDDLVSGFDPQVCTLRAAIEEANALTGRQSILIDSSKGPFYLHHGELVITEGVDVHGYGARAVIDAETRDRVLRVEGADIVNLSSLELANGDATVDFSGGRGGGLSIVGGPYVQMRDSVIRHSRGNFGGGIYVDGGTLVLRTSAVRDNIAGTPDNGIDGGGQTQRGGGIMNREGVVKIYESSIFQNLAVRGGGISNFGGLVEIESSSIIDNEALGIGGGIENHDNGGNTGHLDLNFVTISHNQAGTSDKPPADQRVGGGLYNLQADVDMANSILAENTDAYGAGDPRHAPDCYSVEAYEFTSYRNNVVGVLNGNCDLRDYGWGTTAWIDHGSEATPLDPGLLNIVWWDHRRYRNLAASSPALDGGASQTAASFACPERDTRSRNRPVGAGCDIGGVERQ